MTQAMVGMIYQLSKWNFQQLRLMEFPPKEGSCVPLAGKLPRWVGHSVDEQICNFIDALAKDDQQLKTQAYWNPVTY